MATISPTSSALDVPSLVSQLMALERKPIDNLNTKVSSYQAKISALGTISGLTSTFQSALKTLENNLQGYSATPSDANVFSAYATSSAVAANYTLNVTKIAQSQNLVTAGQALDTSAIAGASASTATFTIGTTSTDVSIAANATLQDIRTAINAANIGVTATIVNDGNATTPYRLALTSNATGASNAISNITVQAGGDANINNLLAYNPTTNPPAAPTLTQTLAAQDAAFTVNGIAISSASNTVTGAIQGVTLTLKTITATPATLTVARDTNAINTAASGFVDAYNALASKLKSSSAYGTATTAAPVLAGDGSVRLMQEQLRGIINSPATPASGGVLTMLSQVGISYQTDGTLKLDSSKLNNEINKNFSDVSNLFSSATGFLTRMKTWSTSVLSIGGLISTRTANINTSIKNANTQISQLENRMAGLKKQYTTTYTNLNGFLNSMNNMSAYLTSQFSKGTSS